MISGIEWIIVAGIVVAILFFGSKKTVEWAKALGEARKAFEDASKGKTDESETSETSK